MNLDSLKFKIYDENARVFNLKKERIKHPDREGVSMYRYSSMKTRESYKQIVSSVPLMKGAVILYGVNGTGKRPLDCIWSESFLREKFSKTLKTGTDGEKTDRFSWMESLLLSGKYREIEIFTTSDF